jgi:tetratricopeptide (TPR) repeat protein
MALTFLVWGTAESQEGFESAEILFTRAVLAYEEGNYPDAARDLLKAHELDPGHIDVIFYLGLAFNAQGEFQQAARYLSRGMELQPKNNDLRYEFGIALYGQNRFDDALKELLAIHQVEPQKDNLGYYIGLCYYQKKDYETALGYFRKNLSTNVKIRQLNQYYLGLGLQALGRESEAIEELVEVIKIEPAAPIVGATQQLLTVMREKTGAKRLRLEATFNAQYDTNPGGENKAKKSWGNLLNARADYTLYQSGPWESTASYSLLQTLNYNVHQEDLNDHIAGANIFYKTAVAGIPANVGLQLNNDILLLGGRKFIQRPTATLSFTAQENAANFTTGLLRYQYRDFFQDNSRDASNELVGMVHYLSFGGGQHQIYLGYHYDHENASGTEWSYDGYKAIAGLTLSLPWELRGAANAEFHARFYDRLSGEVGRADREATLLVTLAKDVQRDVTAMFTYLLDRNLSTVSEFRTLRHVAALGVTWRY